LSELESIIRWRTSGLHWRRREFFKEAVGVISDQEAMQIKVCELMAQGSYMSAVNLLLEDK